MNQEVIILIAEDDEGHAELIRKNLGRAGLANRIIHFRDGQETVDFLFRRGDAHIQFTWARRSGYESGKSGRAQ